MDRHAPESDGSGTDQTSVPTGTSDLVLPERKTNSWLGAFRALASSSPLIATISSKPSGCLSRRRSPARKTSCSAGHNSGKRLMPRFGIANTLVTVKRRRNQGTGYSKSLTLRSCLEKVCFGGFCGIPPLPHDARQEWGTRHPLTDNFISGVLTLAAFVFQRAGPKSYIPKTSRVRRPRHSRLAAYFLLAIEAETVCETPNGY